MARKDEEHTHEIAKKDKDLRRKDGEYQIMLADKEKEIMELRKRLPRAVDGDV